jgi:DtxR family Mn-dependent transcriptional regulator
MSFLKKQLSASLEDYLEAIYVLLQSGNVARSKDIAEHLQVSAASVTGALRTLAERQLIHYKPYGYITLTDKGQQAASRVVRRHEALESFFCDVLGIDPAVAQRSACSAEHAISSEIASRLMLYLEFLSSEKKAGKDICRDFQGYCRQSEKKNQDKPFWGQDDRNHECFNTKG